MPPGTTRLARSRNAASNEFTSAVMAPSRRYDISYMNFVVASEFWEPQSASAADAIGMAIACAR